MVYQTENNKL